MTTNGRMQLSCGCDYYIVMNTVLASDGGAVAVIPLSRPNHHGLLVPG